MKDNRYKTSNHRFIVEPSKELKECFNLRARDRSKEIVSNFGMKLKPSTTLRRV
jgi:hypothetical protein